MDRAWEKPAGTKKGFTAKFKWKKLAKTQPKRKDKTFHKRDVSNILIPDLTQTKPLKDWLIYFVFVSPRRSMENPHYAVRKSLKRKLEADLIHTSKQLHPKISAKILRHVSLLNSAHPSSVSDCTAIKSAIDALSLLAENGTFSFANWKFLFTLWLTSLLAFC